MCHHHVQDLPLIQKSDQKMIMVFGHMTDDILLYSDRGIAFFFFLYISCCLTGVVNLLLLRIGAGGKNAFVTKKISSGS